MELAIVQSKGSPASAAMEVVRFATSAARLRKKPDRTFATTAKVSAMKSSSNMPDTNQDELNIVIPPQSKPSPKPFTSTKQRPKAYTNEHFARAVEKLLPQVIDWLKNSDGDDVEEESARKDLEDAIRHRYYDGGYAIAKYLDNSCSWSPDSELVEILDSASHYASEARYQHVLQWVKENSVSPKHSIGETIMYKNEESIITNIKPESAEYTVYVPSSWPDKKEYYMVHKGGWIVPFEEIDKE